MTKTNTVKQNTESAEQEVPEVQPEVAETVQEQRNVNSEVYTYCFPDLAKSVEAHSLAEAIQLVGGSE